MLWYWLKRDSRSLCQFVCVSLGGYRRFLKCYVSECIGAPIVRLIALYGEESAFDATVETYVFFDSLAQLTTAMRFDAKTL